MRIPSRIVVLMVGLVLVQLAPIAIANRMRDALERYELSTLRIFLISEPRADGTRYALIQDAEYYLHRVEAGDYIGKSDGKITSISSAEIKIVEIVKVGNEYLEKATALECDARCAKL